VIAVQIIVGALMAGILFFLAIALVVRPPTKLLPLSAPGVITMIAIGFAGLLVILRPLVLRILVARARRQILAGTFRAPGVQPGGTAGTNTGFNAGLPPGDAGSLMAVFQGKIIVGAAMLEGGAFFAAIAYLVEGGPIALALAVVLWLGIAAHFPNLPRVIGWIERQLEWLDQERLLDQRS
jgi:hypothetical protein